MPIVLWLVLGLLSGFVVSIVINRRRETRPRERIALDVVLGAIGAVSGGYLFAHFGPAEVAGPHLYSMLIAVISGVVVVWLYDAVTHPEVV
jgi:uncharacterized membrane protein YeaQ/YmgE (transglycosylase-associated protein family)